MSDDIMPSKPKTLRGRLDISILDLEADGVLICNSRSLTQTVILCLASRNIYVPYTFPIFRRACTERAYTK
jgi:hypothetical protein